MNKNTKKLTITDIEKLTENQVKEIADETMVIKEHNIYFVDLEGYYGYSCLVFKNGHHIHYANDYELHHHGKPMSSLKSFISMK